MLTPEVPTRRLDRDFFARSPESLGKALLGQRLVRVLEFGQRLSGLIVETEAYAGPRDKASHAYQGRRTPRNEPMYAAPGTAYVYFTYGMHFCMNIVCGKVGVPVAVLLRALEPAEGMDTMRRLRGREGLRDRDLCSGPAKLCKALAIDRALNALDLVTDPRLFLEPAEPARRADIVSCPRIGIDRAEEWVDKPLRYLVRGHPCISVPPRIIGAPE